MNTRRYIAGAFLTVSLFLTTGISMAQNREQERREAPNNKNTLVGVWETVAPAFSDCETGEPIPGAPTIRILQKFNGDGTMAEENTDPVEGPYRNTGHGIWERTGPGQFRTYYMHYGYSPDYSHNAIARVRSTITLSADGKSFREVGTFQVADPNDQVFFTGCFNSGFRAIRLVF